MKIVYQGSPGAYSHLAAKKIYSEYEFIPYNTFEDCFKHCNENEEHKTIIPVENSIAGRVADIQYLINKYKLQIYAEHFQEIKHNLMILKDNELKNVKSVRSHSQAISQCQKLINSNRFEPIIAADTAGSAKYISEKKIKVRFNADVSNKLKLYFQPVEREIITKIGKSNTVNYEVINNTGKDILITSTYNVTPQKAGLYFNKLDCFCYEERKVLAGQKIVLPVTFFISPEIIDDPNTSELKSLTLSYTFFNVNNINVSNLY